MDEVLLLDGGVQLQRQLGRGAQKGLDDRRAFEGVPVRGQIALRLSDFPLHKSLALLQADLPGYGDVRLFPFTRLEIHHQRLDTPEDARAGSLNFTPTEGRAAPRCDYVLVTQLCVVAAWFQALNLE